MFYPVPEMEQPALRYLGEDDALRPDFPLWVTVATIVATVGEPSSEKVTWGRVRRDIKPTAVRADLSIETIAAFCHLRFAR